MLKKIILVLTLFVSLTSWAQEIPERPNPPRLVNDLANVLSDAEEQRFEMELAQFARETSNQIAVVTVPSLNGYPASDFAFQLGEAWGIGQKDKDNGVVVLFKPKTKAYEELGGFIKIGSIFPPVWDWQSFWNMTAFLSIILAIMNVLPIPALDGGHVMFTLFEMVTGRKPGDKFLEYAQIVGMVLLLALLLYANLNDIIGLFNK